MGFLELVEGCRCSGEGITSMHGQVSQHGLARAPGPPAKSLGLLSTYGYSLFFIRAELCRYGVG